MKILFPFYIGLKKRGFKDEKNRHFSYTSEIQKAFLLFTSNEACNNLNAKRKQQTLKGNLERLIQASRFGGVGQGLFEKVPC